MSLWDEEVNDLSSQPQGIINPALTYPIPPRRGKSRNISSLSSNKNTPSTIAEAAARSFATNPSVDVLAQGVEPLQGGAGIPNETSLKTGTYQDAPHCLKSEPTRIANPPAWLTLPAHDRISGLNTSPIGEPVQVAERNWSSKQDGHRQANLRTMGAHGSTVILNDTAQNIERGTEPCSLMKAKRSDDVKKNLARSLVLPDSPSPPTPAPRARPQSSSTSPVRMKTSQSKNSVKSILLQDRSASSNTVVYPEGLVVNAGGNQGWTDYPSAVAADGPERCDPRFALGPLTNASNNASRNKIPAWNSQTTNNAMDRRRRNFSSSSLPLSLVTTHTIEEVDDPEEGHHTSGNDKSDIQEDHQSERSPKQQQQQQQQNQQQRSNSYGGSIAPRAPRIPLRVLRREARVPSMGSPPRTHHLPTCTSASCPACCDGSPVASNTASNNKIPGVLSNSANTSPCNSGPPSEADTTLSDVDIVGESFNSRYPWQRDVGIQCCMQPDSGFMSLSSSDLRLQLSHQNRLQRAASGPNSHSYFRSLSGSSNNSCGGSPRSSPPLVPGTPGRPVVPPARPYLYNQRYNGSMSSVHHQLSPANMSPSDPSYQHIHNIHQQELNKVGPQSSLQYSYSIDANGSLQGYDCTNQQHHSVNQTPQLQQPRHKPPLYRSHTTSPGTPGFAPAVPHDLVNSPSTPGQGSPFSTRRANFKRRPRPSSMGAVENIR